MYAKIKDQQPVLKDCFFAFDKKQYEEDRDFGYPNEYWE